MKDFFPFTRYAIETPHYTSSEHRFRDTFLAAKPKDMSWFAYDVVIKSPICVEFVVYDMRSGVYGGLGDRIGSFEAFVPAKLTREFIAEEAKRHAQVRRDLELAAAEREIVDRYAGEILEAIKEPSRVQRRGGCH